LIIIASAAVRVLIDIEKHQAFEYDRGNLDISNNNAFLDLQAIPGRCRVKLM
jgi:hypothetical protein